MKRKKDEEKKKKKEKEKKERKRGGMQTQVRDTVLSFQTQFSTFIVCSIRSNRGFKLKKLAQIPVFTCFNAINMQNKVKGEFVGE